MAINESMHPFMISQTRTHIDNILCVCHLADPGVPLIIHRSQKCKTVWYSESTVSGHRQFRATFAKTFLFFQNVTVYRFINYPVNFPNLLAA